MAVIGALLRLVRGLVILVLALGMVAVAGLAGLAWRLAQGPIPLDWAARHIEAAANQPDSPTRLSIGGASVTWGGFAAGAGQGLELRLDGLRVQDRGGKTVATVNEAELTVSMGRLLLGAIVPRAVSASGVEFGLTRDADGLIALDLGGLALPDADDTAPAPDLAQVIAELARPVRRDGAEAPPGLQMMEQLQRLRIDGARIRLQDRALQGAWRLDLSDADLTRQPGGGVLGSAAATLGYAGAVASLRMDAELGPAGRTRLRMEMAPLAAGAVQSAMSEAGLAAAPHAARLDAPVQASATLTLSPRLLPEAGTLRLSTGAGRVEVAGTRIPIDAMSIDAEASWQRPAWASPGRLRLAAARAVLRGPEGRLTTLTATGEARRAEDDPAARIAVTLAAGLDRLAFADIAALWPARLGGNVRPWVTENLTGGTARDGTVTLALDATPDLADIRVRSIDGRLVGEDTVIWWLRPVQPIERAQAILTIRQPDALEIAIQSARQGPLTLKDGLIKITGLDVKDQFLALTADASGGVAELLGLLRHSRLRLLDRKPIPMRNPGGAFAGKLAITLPLNHDLDFDDVKIAAQGRFTDLRLGGLVAGRDLDRGDVAIDATSEALKLSGTAAIAGIPAELSMDMDFRGGGPAQVVQRAQAAGRATARQLAGAGLDPGGLIDQGAGRFTAKFAQRRDGAADLQVTADLRDAGLALAGWKKPPGQPAEASARVLLRGDRMLGIDQLRAQGPGMEVQGRADMVGNRPLLLVLDRIVLGPTRAAGQVRFPEQPNQPIRASLDGTVLDLSAEFAARAAPPDPTPGPPWIADVRFDRVLLAPDRFIAAVTAHAEHDGRRLAVLSATSAGPERLDATIRPEGAGRRLAVRAADGGAVLRAMDVVDTVLGGRLALDAVFEDARPGPPLAGTANLAEFHVRNAPALGKLLQAVTIYGVVDALSGPGLFFTELTMPFRWDGGTLDLTDARAFSASLGLTAKGRVDTRRGTLDLAGTVVPAYVLNSLLGRIPLVGRLFSAERGGGLVAVNYTLRGPLANPQVGVNPLSALTPGFLRGIFGIFD